MLFCAGNSENFKFATPIGIGLIKSAINLTKILIKNSKIDEIIFIGTAGIYDKNAKLLEIYECESCANLEISKILDKSYSPIENFISNVSHETFKVNSSNYITKDEEISKIFYKKGFLLENMEFYSVLEVAKEFNVKAKGIFITTNYCNKFAHSDFIKNHSMAKEKLIKYLKDKGLI